MVVGCLSSYCLLVTLFSGIASFGLPLRQIDGKAVMAHQLSSSSSSSLSYFGGLLPGDILHAVENTDCFSGYSGGTGPGTGVLPFSAVVALLQKHAERMHEARGRRASDRAARRADGDSHLDDLLLAGDPSVVAAAAAAEGGDGGGGNSSVEDADRRIRLAGRMSSKFVFDEDVLTVTFLRRFNRSSNSKGVAAAAAAPYLM